MGESSNDMTEQESPEAEALRKLRADYEELCSTGFWMITFAAKIQKGFDDKIKRIEAELATANTTITQLKDMLTKQPYTQQRINPYGEKIKREEII